MIVSMMERQSGPGERLGLSLCGLAMWRASSRVTLISLEKQGSAKYNAAQCHTEFCKGKFVSMDSSSVYKFINDLLLNLMNFTRCISGVFFLKASFIAYIKKIVATVTTNYHFFFSVVWQDRGYR